MVTAMVAAMAWMGCDIQTRMVIRPVTATATTTTIFNNCIGREAAVAVGIVDGGGSGGRTCTALVINNLNGWSCG